MESICEIVRDRETAHLTGTTQQSKYVQHSLYETVETIEAYIHSVHTSGKTDSLGREKPFFNIVVAARNIWFRATSITRRNIRIKASKASQTGLAFLANVHLQQWMNKVDYGTYLVTWGLTLATYGSAVTKWVKINGVLTPRVIPWTRLIVDAVDFENNPKIEILYMTPAQLRKAVDELGYDSKAVEALIAAHAETSRKTLDGQQKDNLTGYIKLYEVHGELPLSMLTGKEKDEKLDRNQMHVVSFVETEKKDEYEDFTLYAGKEKEDIYDKADLMPMTDRTLSIGAVEYLFEAQWMQNHSIKAIKDQLDIASKLIFQTADQNFGGRNILEAIETGDILIHADNKPLEVVGNVSHDITSLLNFKQQWDVLGQNITSTPDAIRGNTQPSGTPYALQQLLTAESHSLFDVMIRNKALAIERSMRLRVIPYLETTLDTTDEIAATLASEDIEELDAMYVPALANHRGLTAAVNAALNDKLAAPFDAQAEQQKVKAELAQLGNRRFFAPHHEDKSVTWADVFDGFQWDAEMDISDENIDKQAVLTTLSSVLQTVASNPAILQDPNARLVFNRILEETGRISPIQLTRAATAPTPQIAAPTQTPTPTAAGGTGGLKDLAAAQ